MVEHGVAGAHHAPRDLRRRGVEGEVSELGDGAPVAVVIEIVALWSHGYSGSVICSDVGQLSEWRVNYYLLL